MEREVIRRRDLPHWDVPGAAYFVTTCLKGSIPAQGLLEIARFREELRNSSKPAELSEQQWEVRRWKLAFVRLEDWLDRRAANRVLEQSRLARVVVDAMHFFAGERYDLL